MFSVLSRLTKPADAKKVNNTPLPMSSSLQKKFSRGVDYNMKILIKGDRNVGKSCLLQRLQGGPFIEEYIPTDQIQVAPIHWKYKDSEYIIKVEVWEVVDKGRVKSKAPAGLKIDNAFSPSIEVETPPLDATFLDVYANANGVIMMMDITKTWTFDYVKREIASVPVEIPIIVLGNHCDMYHHSEIKPYDIQMFLSMAKKSRSGPIQYAETSMRYGFGLKLLHKYLNIPFLHLQRTTLLNQLSANNQEMIDAFIDLQKFENSNAGNYASFVENLSSKRTSEANPEHQFKIASDKSPSIVLGGGKPIIPPNVNPLSQTNFEITSNKPVADIISQMKPKIQLFQNKGTNEYSAANEQKSLNPQQHNAPTKHNKTSSQFTFPAGSLKPKDDIDDFCAGVLDHSFLDDFSPTSKTNPNDSKSNVIYDSQVHITKDSDSDGESGANPLVIGVQDDLDSADDEPNNITKNLANMNMESGKFSSSNYSIHTPNTNMRPFNNSNSNYNQNNVNYKSPNPDVNSLDLRGSMRDWKLGQSESETEFHSDYDQSEPAGINITPFWPIDTSIRRSPEGGEGNSTRTEIKKEDAEYKQEEKQVEKKHKKPKKNKERKTKEYDGEKSKDKEKKHKEKKYKKKSTKGDLEDFLNDSNSKNVIETYEVI